MSPSSKRRDRPEPPAKRTPEPAPTVSPDPSSPSAPQETPEEVVYFRSVDSPGYARLDRFGAAAGIAYALLGFVGSWLLPIGRVEPTDSAEVIARELVAERGRVSAGILLTLFSLFFLVVFVSWLHSWLREAEGEGGWLATLAFAGGVLLVAMLSIVIVLEFAFTVLEDYGPDPVIARTLLVLQWQVIAIVFVPAAAFIGGTSMVGSTSGQLPRWLSFSGMAIALGLLIPPLAFLPFLLSNLWTGLLAVFLFQRARGRV